MTFIIQRCRNRECRPIKKLTEKFNQNKHFKSEVYFHFKHQLDKETSQDLKLRDFEKIQELTDYMNEVFYSENRDDFENIEKVYRKIEKQRKINSRLSTKIKNFIPVIVCAVLMIAVNFFTIIKFDKNAFSIAFEFIQNGFYIDLSKPEVIELPTSQDDPFGIFAECAKYDIYPQAPYYLPEGYVLTNVRVNTKQCMRNYINFIYENGNKNFGLYYKKYWGSEHEKVNLVHEDCNQVSEININGKPAIISKGKKQISMAYEDDHVVLIISANRVPYDEFYKIVESIRHKGEFLWLESF